VVQGCEREGEFKHDAVGHVAGIPQITMSAHLICLAALLLGWNPGAAWRASSGARHRSRRIDRGASLGVRSVAGDAGEEDAAVAAAKAMLQSNRPTSGVEAFSGTTWSVLMRMTEGGSSIFTVQLLEDSTCRFSDSDRLGGWECKRDWVVIEKPKGFFDQTLFFSAKLSPPTKEKPKWRLVDGLVQRAQPTVPNATASPAEPAGGEAEAPPEVEVVQLGTFGANEFEEALLTMMPRFQE
jgi:hypothetical protein